MAASERSGSSSLPPPRESIFSPGDLILGVATVAWLLVTAFYCARDVNPFYGLLVALASPVVTPLWLAVPAWALVVAVRRLRSRAYVAAGLSALIPVIAIGVLWYGPYTGAFIRFEFERPQYEATIRDAVQGDGPTEERNVFRVQVGPPTLAIFPWGGLFLNWSGVIYDATDTVLTGTPRQLPQQIPGSVANELAACLDEVSRLGGHYYLGHFHC